MAKNIIIQEGAVEKSFTASKLVTQAQNHTDTVTWVPEDEVLDYVSLGQKTVNYSGTYRAADDNLDGYTEFVVDDEDVIFGEILVTRYGNEVQRNGNR